MSIVYFILVLGVTILVHELGHYLFARLSGIHIYEFAIGMGKKLWSHKSKKTDIEYSLRLIPLGGFVRLAGEDIEDEEEIPKDKLMYNKGFFYRLFTLIGGALFNFLLAILLLFFVSFIWGNTQIKPILGEVDSDYPAYEAGIREGDRIISINNEKTSTWDDASFIIAMNNGKRLTFKVEHQNGDIVEYKITPVKLEEDDTVSYRYGISMSTQREYGFVNALNYSVNKTGSLFRMMFKTIKSLFTGGASVKDLSGPIGIYTVVDSQSKEGIASILYLVAFLCINVGFVNLIPLPAFDGGRILFLLIEKIKGSPINPKTENMIHNIGFFLLMGLMIYVTFNDILRLFR